MAFDADLKSVAGMSLHSPEFPCGLSLELLGRKIEEREGARYDCENVALNVKHKGEHELACIYMCQTC
jgi:hypothetical protein